MAKFPTDPPTDVICSFLWSSTLSKGRHHRKSRPSRSQSRLQMQMGSIRIPALANIGERVTGHHRLPQLSTQRRLQVSVHHIQRLPFRHFQTLNQF